MSRLGPAAAQPNLRAHFFPLTRLCELMLLDQLPSESS
jgi:hypothetical protein